MTPREVALSEMPCGNSAGGNKTALYLSPQAETNPEREGGRLRFLDTSSFLIPPWSDSFSFLLHLRLRHGNDRSDDNT